MKKPRANFIPFSHENVRQPLSEPACLVRTRKKTIAWLILVAVLLGTVIAANWINPGVASARPQLPLVAGAEINLEGILASVAFRMQALWDRTSLWYGAISLLAVVAMGLALRMSRNVELQELWRRLDEMSSAKKRAEGLVEERIKKEREARRARDAAIKDLEAALGSMDALEIKLREQQKLLHLRERESQERRSKVNARPDQFTGMGLGRERWESALEQVKELEKSLNGKIDALENQLREEEKLLKSRDAELDDLRSQVRVLRGRLVEMESAKERADGLLQEELKKSAAALRGKDSAFKELEQRLSEKVHILETQLTERQELLKRRNAEVDTTWSEVNALTGRLTELERDQGGVKGRKDVYIRQQPGPWKSRAATQRAESLLQEEQEELRKEQEALEGKESAFKELEKGLTGKIHALESQLDESQRLLESRDGELAAFRGQRADLEQQTEKLKREKESLQTDLEASSRKLHAVEIRFGEKQKLLEERQTELETLRIEMNALAGRLTESGSAKERAENLLGEEQRKKTEAFRARDSAVRELQKTLGGRIYALEVELKEKGELLLSRDGELEARRLELNALMGRLHELGSAKEQAESLLQEELKRDRQALQAKESAIKELEESFAGRIRVLETQLSEKQEVLRSRDGELESLRFAEGALQEQLRKEKQMRQDRDWAIKVLEKNLTGTIDDLEKQLREKETLLKTRDQELEAARSEVRALGERQAVREQVGVDSFARSKELRLVKLRKIPSGKK